MKKRIKENTTEISIIDNQCPIPLESLAILVTGEDNKNFKCLSKKITSDKVRVVLKHRETGERVKVVVPTEFLEFHKILYKNAVIPTDIQIAGVLDDKVNNWEVLSIVKGLLHQADLVIVKCLQSGKKISCKVPTQDIEKTKHYIDKSVNKEQLKSKLDGIDLWRETECQREIQVRQNLQQLMYSPTHMKV